MALPYNDNVPLSTDIVSQTQQPIHDDFASLKTIIENDHNAFASGVPGTHYCVRLNIQGAVPTPTPGGALDQMILYSKDTPAPATQELYIKRDVNSGGEEIPMTKRLAAATGYTYLPSGLLIKWGEVASTNITTLNSVTGKTIAFPVGAGIPVFKVGSTFSVSLTPNIRFNTSGYLDPSNYIRWVLSSFTDTDIILSVWTNKVAKIGFHFLAIGLPA